MHSRPGKHSLSTLEVTQAPGLGLASVQKQWRDRLHCLPDLDLSAGIAVGSSSSGVASGATRVPLHQLHRVMTTGSPDGTSVAQLPTHRRWPPLGTQASHTPPAAHRTAPTAAPERLPLLAWAPSRRHSPGRRRTVLRWGQRPLSPVCTWRLGV